MYVNCAHGKGIKFIREELKFFAKTHIHSNGGDIFKSIVLLNADKLTIDAQSALRRCIELFSHTTRFFIIGEDKYKLLKPILSRFCEIYIPEPMQNGESINLYKYNLNETFKLKTIKTQRMEWLKKELHKSFIEKKVKEDKDKEDKDKEDKDKEDKEDINEKQNKCESNPSKLIEISEKIYEKGYSGLDIIHLLENQSNFFNLTNEKIFELLFVFNRVKKEFRNEKLLIMFILNFIFISLDFTLENITFM
jgi:DNA polymerase III delta prime subunit